MMRFLYYVAAIVLLLFASIHGQGMSLQVSGNATGTGGHNMSIIAPGANVTGNNSSWVILWEDNLYDGYDFGR